MWRRRQVEEGAGTTGPVRLGRDTARLLTRLEPGDIAVVDHLDLDAASAHALVACGVAAVVNAAPSTSGRYPNLGPGVLVDAGIPLLDAVGEDIFLTLTDGRAARLDGTGLWVGDERVAAGARQDSGSVAAAADLARAGLAAQLADLATNATGFLLDERDLLLEGVGIPRLRTDIRGRHVLVVSCAYGAAEELALLRGYRREHRPVVIGVDGGADLLLAHKIRADVLVGDLALMSDTALLSAGEVVAGGMSDAEGRLQRLGISVIPFVTSAASGDRALLLADQEGAAVIVAVGCPTNLKQLLDCGRAGASSSLLVRLGLQDRVVGARAAALLVQQRFPYIALLLLVIVTGLVCTVALGMSGGEFDLGVLDARWQQVVDHVTGRWT